MLITGVRNSVGARGQAMAEFALIAPLLFLLLFGVIQIGLLMAAQNGLVNGVRDTARRAATYRINEASLSGLTFAAICDTVETNLITHLNAEVPGFDPLGLTRTVSYDWKLNADGTTYFLVAHVDATYANPLYIPLVSRFLPGAVGDTLPLSASEEMRVENPSLTTPSSTASVLCTP
jgi:Flp pilus assembly protein TadG